MSTARSSGMGWIDILRCGLVQTALGAIVVLTTSTYNRVMVVELALPAMVPGALVALHYAIQLSRPRWGYGSDMGARRTNWIIGGVAVLGIGAVLAAIAHGWLLTAPPARLLLHLFSCGMALYFNRVHRLCASSHESLMHGLPQIPVSL